MDLGNFSLFFLCLTAFLEAIVTCTSNTKKDKYEKLCSKYDQVVKSGVSDEELERLLEHEMELEIHNVLKEQNLDPLSKKGNSWHFNGMNSDIVVQSKDKVGQYGQLVRTVDVGTGNSMGTYDSVFSLNQINHHIIQSTFKEILATIEASISTRKEKLAKSEKMNRSSSALNRKVRKSCQDMIEAAYKRLQKKMEFRSDAASKGSKEKNLDSPNRGDKNYYQGRGNSTLIDTQSNIGPNGYSANVINLATGQASNSGQRHMFDFQSHGKYLDSSVDLFRASIAGPISLKKVQRKIKRSI